MQQNAGFIVLYSFVKVWWDERDEENVAGKFRLIMKAKAAVSARPVPPSADRVCAASAAAFNNGNRRRERELQHVVMILIVSLVLEATPIIGEGTAESVGDYLSDSPVAASNSVIACGPLIVVMPISRAGFRLTPRSSR